MTRGSDIGECIFPGSATKLPKGQLPHSGEQGTGKRCIGAMSKSGCATHTEQGKFWTKSGSSMRCYLYTNTGVTYRTRQEGGKCGRRLSQLCINWGNIFPQRGPAPYPMIRCESSHTAQHRKGGVYIRSSQSGSPGQCTVYGHRRDEYRQRRRRNKRQLPPATACFPWW